jgi:hypothetical protein
MRPTSVRAVLLLGASAGLALVTTAEASPRDRGRADSGYVVAESRFGNGTVSGPVRRTSTGYEVRLPGGTWLACRSSCSETLRVETVDFWQNQGRGRIDNEAGLLGDLTIRRRF